MRYAIILFLMPAAFGAEGPGSGAQDVAAIMAAAAERQRAAVIQAMGPSVERQRRSIRAQVQTATEADAESSGFFAIPWPKTPSLQAAVFAECDPLPASEVEALIEENSRNAKLQPELLREVMRKESAFRPCAVSSAGAQGLMQLMPATASQFHVSDAFDAKQNVAAGAKFLKTLLTRYGGDVSLALGAYNAGPGRVDEAGGVPAIPETQNYVTGILGALFLQ